jgi:threonine dehydrogenase-like Zn-dependent dehydrogenase
VAAALSHCSTMSRAGVPTTGGGAIGSGVEDEETVRAAAYGLKPLLQRIERGEIDPTRIITHTLPLDDAERGFEIFKNKQDNCEKVVLKP